MRWVAIYQNKIHNEDVLVERERTISLVQRGQEFIK